MKYLRYYFFDIIPFLLVAALIIVIVRFIKCKKACTFNVKREILYLIFYLYLTALALKTVVPAEFLKLDFTSGGFMLPDKELIFNDPYFANFYLRICIQWKLWFRLFDIYIINIILLVPFGFLFPILYPDKKKYTVFYGFLISCLIEFIQLFLPRITDTYDLFLNTISVIIGYVLYLLFVKAADYINSRKKEHA